MDVKTATMIQNGVVWLAACTAIGYACKVTKSAMPLWAMLLIPSWTVKNIEPPKED